MKRCRNCHKPSGRFARCKVHRAQQAAYRKKRWATDPDYRNRNYMRRKFKELV